VEIKIFYGLIVLLIISTGTVFAQESLINVQTDDSNYIEGNVVVVSGSVFPVLPNTPVVLQLFMGESLVDIAQITVAQDGNFSHTIVAGGQLWKQGDYLVRVSYDAGGRIIAETEFSFSPKSESIETTTNFEVNTVNHGTFDVKYTIKGGTMKDMITDSSIFGIIVQIESTDNGTISLDLPREFIGAEKQDGKDDTFIILINGMEVAYQEPVIFSDSRVITINFEAGDSDIQIIGTYVVPEFGTIAVMILIAGIITVILVSRNKFQIKV
jgi:predicted secreted protein with PEFG-CTERM motif